MQASPSVAAHVRRARPADGRPSTDAISAAPPAIAPSEYRFIVDSRSRRSQTDGPLAGVGVSGCDIRIPRRAAGPDGPAAVVATDAWWGAEESFVSTPS